MDTETQELVAKQAKEIAKLEEQLAEAHGLNTVLLGQLANKGMDPDHLAA